MYKIRIFFKSIYQDSQKQTIERGTFSALIPSWLYMGITQKSELIIQANTPPYRILQERGISIIVVWWDYLGSNRRPLRCERSALTN